MLFHLDYISKMVKCVRLFRQINEIYNYAILSTSFKFKCRYCRNIQRRKENVMTVKAQIGLAAALVSCGHGFMVVASGSTPMGWVRATIQSYASVLLASFSILPTVFMESSLNLFNHATYRGEKAIITNTILLRNIRKYKNIKSNDDISCNVLPI